MTRRHGRAGAALLASVALVATGCTGAFSALPMHVTSPVNPAPNAPVKAALTAFHSCQDALAALRNATEASVTAYGLPGSSSGGLRFAANDATGAPVPAAAAPAAAGSAAAGSAAAGTSTPAYSGTNDYTAGVDEPDLVKTDGQRIVTVSGDTLDVIDAASRQVTGTLSLASSGIQGGQVNLLLSGDHVLLLAPYSNEGYASGSGVGYGPRFLLIDIAGTPRVLASYAIQGSLVDARLVGSVVRIVTNSQPTIEFPPLPDGYSNARRVAAYRAVTGRTGLEAWLPQYASQAGTETTTGHVPCTAVSRPTRYSGTNLLTVLTFDMSADSFGTGDPVSVVADGDTVYGTASSLYVASGDMRTAPQVEMLPAAGGPATGGPAPVAAPAAGTAVGAAPMDYAPQPRQDTQIYRFDITGSSAPRFVASGEVPGYLVDQYAMSEWGGYLRVATTTGTSWSIADGRPSGAQTSSSAVYELTTASPVMRVAGKVTGLGVSERIYSVRFMGPVGYVVTFRQTDPLYTLDLSDPSRPRIVGALGLTGYSAYLHPVSASRLIGVGEQADVDGHVLGTQVSLFDVSDLAAPARLATYALTGSYSGANFDPHAFLYWPASQLVVVPVDTYGVVPGTASDMQVPRSGALVLRVTDSGITRTGFISPPASSGYGSSIERSLVIGQTLWTISGTGVLASDLSTLQQQAWLPLSANFN